MYNILIEKKSDGVHFTMAIISISTRKQPVRRVWGAKRNNIFLTHNNKKNTDLIFCTNLKTKYISACTSRSIETFEPYLLLVLSLAPLRNQNTTC